MICMASTVGSSIGAMTIIAGTVSRKHPIKSSTRLMNIRTTYGLSDTLVKKVVIICGTFSKVMKVENTVEYPNKKEVTPFRTDVSRKTLYNPFKFMSLYTNKLMIIEYTTDTQAASVGVKAPE